MISENFVELLPQNYAGKEQGGSGRVLWSWGPSCQSELIAVWSRELNSKNTWRLQQVLFLDPYFETEEGWGICEELSVIVALYAAAPKQQ